MPLHFVRNTLRYFKLVSTRKIAMCQRLVRIFVATIITREKQLSRSTTDRDERTISVAAVCGEWNAGRNGAERDRGMGGGEGGTGRQIGNCLEHIFAHNTIGGNRGVRARVRVGATHRDPPVVRTEPMQKFCYAIIESSCAQFGYNAEYRDIHRVAKENKDSIA